MVKVVGVGGRGVTDSGEMPTNINISSVRSNADHIHHTHAPNMYEYVIKLIPSPSPISSSSLPCALPL